MATRAQLEKYLQNPNVRKFLDLIAHTEGTERNGYRTAFGGGSLSSLSDHPRYLKTFKQKNGKTNTTSAAGRYQFLRGTWDGLARQYGLKDFGPKSQDIAAVALLAQNGALGRILKGDMQGAVRKAGPTWASLPTAPASYSQPTKSWQAVNRFLGGKTSPSQKQQPQQPRFQLPQRRPLSELLAENSPPKAAFKLPERRPLAELLANNDTAKPFALPERRPLSELLSENNQVEQFSLPERKPLAELLGNQNSTEPTQQAEQIPEIPQRRPLAELLAEQASTNETMPNLELQEWQI